MSKRNTIALEEIFKIVNFVKEKEVDASLHTGQALCDLITRNTGIKCSPTQLKRIYDKAGLEWNVIGSKSNDSQGRRTVRVRMDDIEPKVVDLEERVSRLEDLADRAQHTATVVDIGHQDETISVD